MGHIEDFGAKVNKYGKIKEYKNFCNRGKDIPLAFNQYIS